MFRELFSKLPDGAFWPTGQFFKAFAAKLDADRARLAPNSGNEIPTQAGRFFSVTQGGTFPDLPVYDLDGTTVLHAGGGSTTLSVSIDDEEPMTVTHAAWYKTEFCDDGDVKTAFVLRTPLV